MRAALSLFLLTLNVAAASGAAPEPKLMFEDKCLFCHSSSVIEQRRLSPARWREVVQKMRARAPLLIGRADVDVIVRYMVRELKLVPPRPAVRPEPPTARPALPGPIQVPPETPPQPPEPEEELAEPAPPGPGVATAALPASRPHEEVDTEAEALGPQLVAQRCSKCHTLFRVFTKVDSVVVGESIIERMRRKTGSGISPHDAAILKRFLRSRAAQ